MAVELTNLNTLHVSAFAKDLVTLSSADQIPQFISQGVFQQPFLFLGQGANILFTRDFPGTVIKNELTGIGIVKETDQDAYVEIASGQNWHELVTWAVNHNLSGIENMALIPGTVGAAAYGNIAAYGQNFVDVFDRLEAINLATGKSVEFNLSDCKFGYRESIFKHEFKDKYFLSTVTLRLSKTPHLDTSYHTSRHQSLMPKILEIKRSNSNASEPITVKDVFAAVVALRTEKLPDWKVVPNAGSFFKNPLVSRSVAEKIKTSIPDLQLYPADKLLYSDPTFADSFVKLPAGMLLDNLGWRGKRSGNVGTSPSHALVVINYGASGKKIYEFTENMRSDIRKNFDINLEYEVTII